MTWDAFHHRGEVLRNVVAAADRRRDGILPTDVEGVRETFASELELFAALALRWHTRLAGRIERELMSQPMDLESAVVAAWRATAEELPGIRAVLDHYAAEPLDAEMAAAVTKSVTKEHLLLAQMSGRSSELDEASVRVGERIAARAREPWVPASPPPAAPRENLIDRLKALVA